MPGTDLALTLHLPDDAGLATYSHTPSQNAYVLPGNAVSADFTGAEEIDGRYYVTPGATHVLFHFGLNDVGLPGMAGEPPATAQDLIAGFTELADRARSAGPATIGMTMGPYAGTIYPGVDTPEGRAVRREVNAWIRTSTVFDAVADIAAAVQDPDAPCGCDAPHMSRRHTPPVSGVLRAPKDNDRGIHDERSFERLHQPGHRQGVEAHHRGGARRSGSRPCRPRRANS